MYLLAVHNSSASIQGAGALQNNGDKHYPPQHTSVNLSRVSRRETKKQINGSKFGG